MVKSRRNRRDELEIQLQKKKEKHQRRIDRKKRDAEHVAKGEEVEERPVPKTIENQRTTDETMIGTVVRSKTVVPETNDEEKMEESEELNKKEKSSEDDEENFDNDDDLLSGMKVDEMADFLTLDKAKDPKLLVMTKKRANHRTRTFCREISKAFYNCKYVNRRGFDIKKMVPRAAAVGFTHLVLIDENNEKPNSMLISRLPDGPTARFKIQSTKITSEMSRIHEKTKNCNWLTHRPEMIINNMSTRLGLQVGRFLATMFPQDPSFRYRRVCTFHNQRDFIFFRHHRYQFEGEKKADLMELGPRFTMRLQSLQKGTFDSKFGEYEFLLKRHDMEIDRRKFIL
ncbi:hypothetical protein SNEBB_007109 [Seison nebaliae]|nr:hypothetical protein SNEBB_007109 [Seison nebaliae]